MSVRLASGTVKIGSIADKNVTIPKTYPRSDGVFTACAWYITPLKYENVSLQQNEQLPDVSFTMLRLDLAAGDRVEVYDDFSESNLIGRFEGTGALINGGFKSVSTKTGQMKVVLRTTSSYNQRELRTGFMASYKGSSKIVIDLYFVAGVVISTVSVCMCCLCGMNRLINRLRAPVAEVEPTLDDVVATAQRTGRGAPVHIINSFPAYVFQHAQVSQTPLARLQKEDLQVRWWFVVIVCKPS